MRNALIIHNPWAGRQRARRRSKLEEARRVLREAGIDTQLEATRGRGSATELARQAVLQGCELVLGCGGDGTVNEIVNGLAGSQVPLAVLPAGTANVLAKELRLPWDIPAAARLAARSQPRRIALGEIVRGEQRRYFLCVAGAGPDGAIVHAVNEAAKLRAGILVYWWEGARQLVCYRFPLFRVGWPGLDRELEASLVIVGRTKHYGGPFRITTQASLFDDCFELAILTTRNRLRYLAYLPTVWLGRMRRQRGVFFAKTSTLRCELLDGGPVHAQVDGEPAGTLPAEFRIVPAALTLMVPEEQ